MRSFGSTPDPSPIPLPSVSWKDDTQEDCETKEERQLAEGREGKGGGREAES